MDVVTDGLMIAGTLFAGVYCWVLAGRVRALKSLDSGLGGAIVTLTRQIELARATLDEARAGSRETRQDLTQLIARSDAAAAQLRLLLAAIEKSERHPAKAIPAQAAPAPVAPDEGPVPVVAVPSVDGLVARRRETAGPRLVPAPAPQADADDDDAPEPSSPLVARDSDAVGLPKPRRPMSLDGLLRRRAAPVADPAPRSEADLIAALTALAAGGER